jgi:phosphoserine phosphatase
MECAVVLIANSQTGPIDDNMVVAVAQALKPFAREVDSQGLTWLAPGIACEFTCVISDQAAAVRAARNAVANTPVDVCCVPKHGRRKKLLVADMDSTIITFETIDEVAIDAGDEIGKEIAKLTTRAMAGDMDYATAFRQRATLLQGVPSTLLAGVRDRIVLTGGARELVATMRGNGAICALVSSGLTVFTDHVADQLNFDHAWGNQLEIADGNITGNVVAPIRDGSAKRDTLNELKRRYKIEDADTIAVGDGANDLDMISAAGVGVAFHAKPVVAEQADARIDHTDLSTLLYLQGYSIENFRR